MSLKKQFLKTKPVCKVTFALTKQEVNDAKKVILLGDFNNWNSNEGIVLKKLKDGSCKVAIDLETGKEYQFKYLIDGTSWVNDAAADKYVGNGMGAEENSVVIL